MIEAGDDYNRAAQVERTVLSWNRSALALAANAGLLIHEGFQRGLVAITALGFAVGVLAALLWVFSTGRYPSALGAHARHLLGGGRELVVGATVFVVALSAVDLLLVAT
jgi:hypothetical protein